MGVRYVHTYRSGPGKGLTCDDGCVGVSAWCSEEGSGALHSRCSIYRSLPRTLPGVCLSMCFLW